MRRAGGLVAAAALLLCPAGAQAACSVGLLLELPVTLSDGYRPMVAATVNGIPSRFIADSGAFFSILSPGAAAAAKLRLMPAPPWFRISGLGGTASVSLVKVKDFALGGVTFHDVDFIVGGTDTGTTGLLGQNVLGLGDVEYDLPHGMIRLFRSHDCGSKAMAYWAAGGGFAETRVEPTNERQRHTFVQVTVNGVALRALLDTGAPSTILSLKAAARLGIHPGDPGVREAPAAMGLGRKASRAWSAPIKTFGIADEEVRNVRLHIVDTQFLADTDVVLGGDFLISHRIYVDNAAHRMFFTYAGGTVFARDATHRDEAGQGSAAAPPGGEKGEPADAEAYSRRGAVALVQRDFPHAIADFTKAIELAPKSPAFLLQRAEAYLRTGRTALGAADLNRAVELDPGNVLARIQRARLRASIAERDAALADLDAAARALVGPLNERIAIGQIYTGLAAYDRAVAQYDLWLAAHPEDAHRAEALNGRCWARALWGRELDKALADCNAALKLRKADPQMLDSRGLVHLRLKQYDAAIADYDEALRAAPKLAWSLYGRGLARRATGKAAEGDADIRAALALQPDLGERARKAGVE
jgi:tetratricopeptide (TPR) repeat protein/predicted aspartyl protease